MTNEEARKVLEGMGATSLINSAGATLSVEDSGPTSMPWLAAKSPGYLVNKRRVLFTADQLEAIAMWMRDPAGVAG